MTGLQSRAGLVLGATLSVGAGHTMTETVAPWAVAICIVAAGVSVWAGRRMESAGSAVWIFSAAAVGALVLAVSSGAGGFVTTLITLVLASAVPWFGGRYLRQQDQLIEEAAQRARLIERSRIARDMHDSLGHELNLLALRAGAIDVDPTLPAAARATALQLRVGASAAIEQLSDIIGVMRAGEAVEWQPPPADPDGLVQRAAGAGMDVTLDRRGVGKAPATVAQCVHRIVQEGLTNAAKHAPAAHVTVQIDADEAETRVVVSNDLPALLLHRPRGAGTGLVALQERVESCGGSLETASGGGTFQIVARIPHRGSS